MHPYFTVKNSKVDISKKGFFISLALVMLILTLMVIGIFSHLH